MLQCPKCNYDNDLGRIFCAKCGEKLDISKVKVPTGIRKRVVRGKRADGSEGAVAYAGKALRIILTVALLAVITLIFLSPRVTRLPLEEKGAETFNEKRQQIEDAISTGRAVEVVFSEGELNAAMTQAVENIKKAGPGPGGMELQSVYLSLGDGTVEVPALNRLKIVNLSSQMTFRPQRSGAAWDFTPVDARIGRLIVPSPVHGKVAGAMGVLFKDLDAERQMLGKVASLKIKGGNVTIETKAAEAAKPADETVKPAEETQPAPDAKPSEGAKPAGGA